MIQGDSKEYEFITEEIQKLNLGDVVLSCEIGLRRGLGSQTIMDAVISKGVPHYRHIAVDPYGNLNYQHYDDVEFAFFEFPDTYFFQTMKDGYPMSIDGNIYLKDTFAIVHLDGPHTTQAVNQEISFL